MFAPDFVVGKEILAVTALDIVADLLLAISRRIADLNITREELICLKALGLITAQVLLCEWICKLPFAK